MSDIDPPNQYYERESVRWEFTIEDDGSAKALSGASVDWWLLPSQGAPTSEAVLSGSDSGVSVSIVDAAAGRIDVVIDQDVTDGLGGSTLWQRLEVDDQGPGLQLWGGYWFIEVP
jgi:hypothetical protein